MATITEKQRTIFEASLSTLRDLDVITQDDVKSITNELKNALEKRVKVIEGVEFELLPDHPELVD